MTQWKCLLCSFSCHVNQEKRERKTLSRTFMQVVRRLRSIMGNHLSNKGTSVPVGKDANLSELAKGIRVQVVDVKGPLGEPANPAEVPTALVTDFWKEQTVVLHILRRFG